MMKTRRLSPQQYTVGWISPMEVEQTAALLMLDEEHERLPQSDTDPTVYHLGCIGSHNVVIAGLPATGNTSTATVVTHMRRSFPNLRFGLLVGIGGGVPTKTDLGRIRLGDVVVSKPSGSHSGAVQYDHGKAEVGQFIRTGIFTPPPATLLNAAQMLAAKRATLLTDPVKEHLKRIDTTRPQLRRYRYPGTDQDFLHSSDCMPSAQGCRCRKPTFQDTEMSDDGSDRDQSKEGTFIFVHRGTIASGEMVIKNGLVRDHLAQQHDVYCFETEAAGAMNDFPCLVIRGISDYCDAYKNNQWHGYAAAVAAAYARELFCHMPVNVVMPSSSTTTNAPDVLKVTLWLSDLDFSLRHNEICCRRQPGTGRWLLQSVEFEAWLNSSQNLLFCSGMPGSGKTFLSSLIVDYLMEEISSRHKVAITYIYCDYKSQEKQKAEMLLKDLLKQLLTQIQEPVPEPVENLYDKYVSGKLQPTIHEIVRHCSQLINLFQQSFLVIDALDEEDVLERRELLHCIFQIQDSTNIKILATSRPIPEIREEFIVRGAAEIETQASDHDVAIYLQAKMHRLPGWVQTTPGLLEETVDRITRASQGMFLLVYLLFESLLYKTTIRAFKRALDDLPTAIKTAYEQVDRRIQKQDPEYRSLAQSALKWVTYTRRLITASELRTALSGDIDEGYAPEEEDLPDIDTIVSVCCGLIEVNQMSQIVRYVHYTAKQYFEEALNGDICHEEIATTCLTYLSLDDFDVGVCEDDREFESLLDEYPLYRYASQEWGYHARDQSTELVARILGFLANKEKMESSSQALKATRLYIGDIGYSQRVPKLVTAAHLVSYFGLDKVAQQLPYLLSDFSICDSESRTPLSWAAQNGHVALVEYILTVSEPTFHVRDRIGSSPLLLAARNGHDKVVKKLTQHDPTAPSLPDYFQRSPLWHAASKGHMSVIDELLSNDGVNVNAADIDGDTPLIRASANGHTRVVEQLIDSGADVNARERRYGRTAFIWAALEGHVEIVQLFVDLESVAWETQDNDGRSALWWASEEGHTTVVRQLLPLSEKMNPNQLDTVLQRSMLSRAAERGNIAIARLLLNARSTDPNLRDKDGLVPLSWAARNGHNDIVLLLLETGRVNINSQYCGVISWDAMQEERDRPKFKPSRRQGQTPLSHAAEMGHKKTVQILLDRGAAIDRPDDFWKTPLMYALENDHVDILSVLLGQGANPNSFNRHEETPLIKAVQAKKVQIVDLLLATPNIEPGWASQSRQTAVWWAVLRDDTEMLEILKSTRLVEQNLREDTTLLPMAAGLGNEAVVRWLLGQGDSIDPDGLETDGRSALCRAACTGHVEIMELLLATGKVNAGRRDNDGRSVLERATTPEATRILLEAGEDPNEQDSKGRTPLSLAVEMRWRGKVEFLLQHPAIDINLCDKRGNTPLMHLGGSSIPPSELDDIARLVIEDSIPLTSWEREDQSMTELLINYGADPHLTNLDGHTVLSFAHRARRRGVIAALRQHGLVMDVMDTMDVREDYSSPGQPEAMQKDSLLDGSGMRWQDHILN